MDYKQARTDPRQLSLFGEEHAQEIIAYYNSAKSMTRDEFTGTVVLQLLEQLIEQQER